MKRILSLTCLLTCGISPCYSQHIYLEKEYQNNWCSKNAGQIEYRLPDSTRIDCLTHEYAIEFDFANKWAESIGQALYYAISTNKKPGIVLIMENGQKDIKYFKRLQDVSTRYNIKVWTMTPEEMPPTKNCAH